MPKTTTLSFELSSKEILNSNALAGLHFIVKGKMVAHLRELAANMVMLEHPQEAQETVLKRLAQLRAEGDWILARKRLKKRLEAKNLSKEEVAVELFEQYPPLVHEPLDITPLYEHFTMRIDVFPPSRRRLDPPNLWPTVKALTDGATDAVGWPDDDFAHLLETAFRYGGLSGNKDLWIIRLVITEVTDLSDFQMTAEIAS
jgi:hypothetical protein